MYYTKRWKINVFFDYFLYQRFYFYTNYRNSVHTNSKGNLFYSQGVRKEFHTHNASAGFVRDCNQECMLFADES